MLKLLSKSEIQKAKTQDQSREVAEGLKISRRVDNLRELQAQEEKNLEKFRIETLSEITKEISDANAQKEAIFSEIRALREEKSRGLYDVESKLRELSSLQENLALRENTLAQKADFVDSKEREIESNLAQSKDELERARSRFEQSDTLHQEAFKAKEDAVAILAFARQSETLVLASQRKEQDAIAKKWLDVHTREEELVKRESSVADKLASIESERSKLSSFKELLDSREKDVEKKLVEIEEMKKEVAQNLKDSRDELDRARTHKEMSITLRKEAEQDRLNAYEKSEEVKKTSTEAYFKIELKTKELDERADVLLAREKELAKREEENDRISKDLENKAVRLADRTKIREKILQKLD